MFEHPLPQPPPSPILSLLSTKTQALEKVDGRNPCGAAHGDTFSISHFLCVLWRTRCRHCGEKKTHCVCCTADLVQHTAHWSISTHAYPAAAEPWLSPCSKFALLVTVSFVFPYWGWKAASVAVAGGIARAAPLSNISTKVFRKYPKYLNLFFFNSK